MLITFSLSNIETDTLIKKAVENYCLINNITVPNYEILRTKLGKPYLSINNKAINPTCYTEKASNNYYENTSDIFISVSHSKNVFLVAVSNKNIGVDVQYNEDNIDFIKVSERFFDKIYTDKKEFYKHFTLAEATVKYNQTTLPKTMKYSHYNGQIVPFFKDYTLAIVGEDKQVIMCEYYKN